MSLFKGVMQFTYWKMEKLWNNLRRYFYYTHYYFHKEIDVVKIKKQKRWILIFKKSLMNLTNPQYTLKQF